MYPAGLFFISHSLYLTLTLLILGSKGTLDQSQSAVGQGTQNCEDLPKPAQHAGL